MNKSFQSMVSGCGKQLTRLGYSDGRRLSNSSGEEYAIVATKSNEFIASSNSTLNAISIGNIAIV